MINQVYAFKNFNEQGQFKGYLLFQNEERSKLFVQLCKSNIEKKGHYELFGLVTVSEFLYKKAQENSSFFVKQLT